MTLRLAGIDCYYGNVQVLRGLHLEAHPGEVLCLLGRNGAGKTTILKTMIGLVKPRAGRILLDGRELTRLPATQGFVAEAAETFFTRLGLLHEWVDDAPGLVLGRIVCQLVNEAAFAVGEGVGSDQDVDTGLVLGLSHPRGAVEWGQAIGLDHVAAVLDGLFAERHEERYRAAPLVRRATFSRDSG